MTACSVAARARLGVACRIAIIDELHPLSCLSHAGVKVTFKSTVVTAIVTTTAARSVVVHHSSRHRIQHAVWQSLTRACFYQSYGLAQQSQARSCPLR